MVIVRVSKPAPRLLDSCGGKPAFFHPGFSNCRYCCIEKAIGVVQRMESENIPACDFGCASHPLPNTDQSIDFIQPALGDALRRHEVIQSRKHDGRWMRGNRNAVPSLEPPKH